MIIFDLFISFFKVGLFSFGGGFSSIPLIKDIVLNYNWISEEAYADIVALSEVTPGPIMTNIATYVGQVTYGLVGSIVATMVVIMPAFVIIIIFAKYLKRYLYNDKVKFTFTIIRPAICSVIFSAGFEILIKNLVYAWTLKEFKDFYNIFRDNNLDILKKFIVLFLLWVVLFIYKKITKKQMQSISFIVVSAIIGIFVFM